ncbi:hypothetical protein FUAX_01820 [Fulvitalea axinellae]|uniref:Tetratricopeptide repeat protein n=1 Tax=Fulvitalea axinellae TaxID=1182444 RepID=A0AAU9DA48_9BACT|nr:hypothetical protein FUAX_01820 [Fulvitalea axinellae]
MKRSHVILGLAVLAVVGILYATPNYVGKKKDQDGKAGMAQGRGVKTGDIADLPVDHDSMLTESQVEDAIRLTKAFESSRNSTEKLKFADSLYGLYLSVNRPDSAAKYAVLSVTPGSEDLGKLKAGDAYYQAFSLATNDERKVAYAEKARGVFEAFLATHPDSLGVKARMAMTYAVSAAPMKAAVALKEVLAQDPNHREALYNLGVLSIQSAQFAKGVERFGKLVELDPTDLQARYYLGVCYFESGKKDEAKKEFEMVKRLSDDPVAHQAADEYLNLI